LERSRKEFLEGNLLGEFLLLQKHGEQPKNNIFGTYTLIIAGTSACKSQQKNVVSGSIEKTRLPPSDVRLLSRRTNCSMSFNLRPKPTGTQHFFRGFSINGAMRSILEHAVMVIWEAARFKNAPI
jgi:hypothetical protein